MFYGEMGFVLFCFGDYVLWVMADSGYWRWWCMLGDGYFGDYGKWYGSLLVCCGVHKLVKANGIVVEKWLKTKV
ncbi:hypothetical protein Hanom_Chr07g00675541 [Helianthus anomalus]